ncbi:Glycosyltransferase family 28 C-terminal domain-containing protein [Paenibacillus algorifonticola]|uniref:UDP-N-acetylglucosamine--N-acetylmuramyl-(pentapeptide) pyrophosphoryl-undecaprenol N-acetylglucosamine transferase n=1 Tax=Paenibacillus algorifonticola TaxID=684063 RepID=A0A1I2GQF8_9BACL|nr:glycosyltransferase [Paenibacillus algorifonticola]SFF19508.1 Glycosyltransferase family 28 C-terminal domain-containing protein [Paenibacillus algorifonticola]
MGRKIMFTGGGTAGHVTVNLALIPRFAEAGWKIHYIGSENGIEKQLTAPLEQLTYHGIATGKLRRYLDWQNVKDPFKVVKGVFQAYRLIQREKPNVIFSKGGFVSVPVVLGAWLNRVPVLIHESDLTPGLANRIAIPFASGVCTTFPETAQHLPSGKSHYVGAVIRDELRQGVASRGRAYCGLLPASEAADAAAAGAAGSSQTLGKTPQEQAAKADAAYSANPAKLVVSISGKSVDAAEPLAAMEEAERVETGGVKPVLLIMGGSLGSRAINKAVRSALGELTRKFSIVHLCGKGQVEPALETADYKQFEYINEQLPDVLAMSDIVLSRAGSNAIFEFLHLRKPMLLIPLTKAQSRGDQLLNADSFKSSGFCEVLHEEKVTPETLLAAIKDVYENRAAYIQRMEQEERRDTLSQLYELIVSSARE